MINETNLTHAWIRTNTRVGLEKTGVSAVVILCFNTEPKSRVALWHAKGPDGKFDFKTPSFPIETPDGELKKTPCLFGGVSAELVKMAAAAQGWLRKGLKPTYGKLYKVTAELAEECQP